MNRTSKDKLVLIAAAASVTAMSMCLVPAWGWAFDTSGRSALSFAAATFLAAASTTNVSVGLISILGRLGSLRQAQTGRLVLWLGARGARPARVSGRAKARSLVIATLAAAACAMVSLVLLVVCHVYADLLIERFLWTPTTWETLKFLVVFVAMIPAGAGLGGLWRVGYRLFGGKGADPYAGYCRTWLWAVAASLAGWSVLWWMGFGVLTIAAATAASVGLVVWRLSARHLGIAAFGSDPRAAEPATTRSACAVVVSWAVAAYLLWLQCRLLIDLFGASSAVTAGWAAVSLAVLARFQGVADRRRGDGGVGVYAAMIGAATIAAMQLATAAAGLETQLGAVAAALLVAGLQVPLLTLAAILFRSVRRRYAAAGRPAHSYASRCLAGIGLGLLVARLAGYGGWGRVLLWAVLVVVAGWGFVAAALRDAVKGRRGWAACGACLSVLCFLPLGLGVYQCSRRVGVVAAGAWLSPAVAPQCLPCWRQFTGYLPVRPAWRSERITRLLEQFLAEPAHQGRWLLAVGSTRDLPARLARRVRPVWGLLDPPGVTGRIDLSSELSQVCDLLGSAEIQSAGQLYDGVFIAPLPVEHGQAWRCYNAATLRKLVGLVHPGSPVVLRIQAGPGDVAGALAVIRSFSQAAGRGWMVADAARGRLDIVVLAVTGDVGLPAAAEGLGAVRLRDFWSGWSAPPSSVGLGPIGGSLRPRLTAWRVLWRINQVSVALAPRCRKVATD